MGSMEENARPDTTRQIWLVALWYVFAAAGALFGGQYFSPFMRGPGDPSGHIVGPVMGGFLGLAIYGLCRLVRVWWTLP